MGDSAVWPAASRQHPTEAPFFEQRPPIALAVCFSAKSAKVRGLSLHLASETLEFRKRAFAFNEPPAATLDLECSLTFELTGSLRQAGFGRE